MKRNTIKAILVTAGLALAGVGVADTLPKLPPDFQIPKHKKSPGVVTFKHGSHVKPDSADCTVCHPKMVKITEAAPPEYWENLKHKVMNKGGECGACHDGNKAFAMDECDSCHASEE